MCANPLLEKAVLFCVITLTNPFPFLFFICNAVHVHIHVNVRRYETVLSCINFEVINYIILHEY